MERRCYFQVHLKECREGVVQPDGNPYKQRKLRNDRHKSPRHTSKLAEGSKVE